MTTTIGRMSAALFSTSLIVLLAAPSRAETDLAIQEASKLHTLFDNEWQWTLEQYPEFATRIGDDRYNDKLTDLSPPAMERRKALTQDVLKRIRAIDRGSLTGQDVLSYDLFLKEAENCLALERFPAGTIPVMGFLMPYEWMPISQMGGIHTSISELPRLAPLRNTKDYNDFLARLEAYPRQIDQVIELMKRGMASGWVPPAIPLAKVLPQIEKHCVGGLSESFIVVEIDRYIVWPGQALGYKIGELKIKALRTKASKVLGARFDLRKFHNALIDDRALPLDLLERRIDQWIKSQR